MEKNAVKRNIPIILKKRNCTFFKKLPSAEIGSNVTVKTLYKDDVLFETKDVAFMKGEFQKLLLVNRLNIVTKFIKTVAKYFNADGTVLEKTSENITTLIGQENYKTVFSGLCSILDQNLKIRSILALLTVESKNVEAKKVLFEKSCQTDEMRIEFKKPRRRIKRQLQPYIVRDTLSDQKRVRKIIINVPQNLSLSDKNDKDNEIDSKCLENGIMITDSIANEEISSSGNKESANETLPDIGHFHDENSNGSIGNYSSLSIETSTELLIDPMSMLVDKHTKEIQSTPTKNPGLITVRDGDKFMQLVLPYKPEDELHIATKDNLQHFDERTRQLLIKHQMAMDLKHCLTVVDEDFNLPIHLAVLNNDIELIRRQCIVLKLRNQTVDMPANGLTPLKLSLFQESTASTVQLLQFGADVLQTDSEHRTPLHLAAELDTDHLKVLVQHCLNNAKKILQESDYWKEDMQQKSNTELIQYLLKLICFNADKQGYIPLMLASMHGIYGNVSQLLETFPSTINYRMPTSGNTALYLACEAACNACIQNGNKMKIDDHFQKTIETLIAYGADPSIDNDTGANVNTLLMECNCQAMSAFIFDQLTKYNVKRDSSQSVDFKKIMLIKNESGSIDVRPLGNSKKMYEQRKTGDTQDQTYTLKKADDMKVKTYKVQKKTGKTLDNDVIQKTPGKVLQKAPLNIIEDVIIKSPITTSGVKICAPKTTPNCHSTMSKTVIQDVKNVIILPNKDDSLKRKIALLTKHVKMPKVKK